MRILTLLICALLAQVGVGGESSIASIYNVTAQIDTLIRLGDAKGCDRFIAKLASEPETKALAVLATAKRQVAAGKVAEARSMMLAYFGAGKQLDGQSYVIQLLNIECLRIVQEYRSAHECAERLCQTSQGTQRARAAECNADTFADQGKCSEALEWLTNAEKAVNAYNPSDEDKTCANSIRGKISRIRQAIDLLLHGPGFILYRDANRQRLASAWKEAIASYSALVALHTKNYGKPYPVLTGPEDPRVNEAPVPNIYAAAARLYRAQCLIVQGDSKGAKADLDYIVASDPANPYRGEAMRMLGDLAMEETADLKTAIILYSEAIAIMGAAKLSGSISFDYAIPDASIAKTRVTDNVRSVDAFGNVQWSQPNPEKVYTASTCSWYADSERMQAQLRRSLCRFLGGDTNGAVGDLAIILEVDDEDRRLTAQRAPSNYLRLSTGFQAGRMYATPAELALFSAPLRVRLGLAELAFETERWDEATVRYKRMLNNQRAPLNVPQKAYIEYAIACAMTFAGHETEIGDLMRGFEGVKPAYGNTVTYWRALAYLANRDPKDQEKWLTIAAQDCPDVSLRLDYQLKLAMLLTTMGRYAEGAAYAEAIIKQARAEDAHVTSGKNLLLLIQRRQGDAPITKPRSTHAP